MAGGAGKNFVAGQQFQEFLIKIIQSVFCKKGGCPDRYNGVMHPVIICKVYIEYTRHGLPSVS
jgi:hypothetical protein